MGVESNNKCERCIHRSVCKNKDEYEAIFKTICDMIDTRKEAEGNYTVSLNCKNFFANMFDLSSKC